MAVPAEETAVSSGTYCLHRRDNVSVGEAKQRGVAHSHLDYSFQGIHRPFFRRPYLRRAHVDLYQNFRVQFPEQDGQSKA